MGKIIVLEGPDGAGKSTQYGLLCEYLASRGAEFRRYKFPRYESATGRVVKAYLDGSFGGADEVNAYAASSFYACDRYASYRTEWKEYYDGGGLVVMDRYVSSNAVYQGAKLAREERSGFFAWLDGYEHEKIGLPRPDAVLWLDVPTEISGKNLARRGETLDIHERDRKYAEKCYESMADAANYFGWTRVECVRDGAMESEEEISSRVIKILRGGKIV